MTADDARDSATPGLSAAERLAVALGTVAPPEPVATAERAGAECPQALVQPDDAPPTV